MDVLCKLIFIMLLIFILDIVYFFFGCFINGLLFFLVWFSISMFLEYLFLLLRYFVYFIRVIIV